jgi:tetratricopeptide (TPR) repeat protein
VINMNSQIFGREDELEFLDRQWNGLDGRSGRAILISGSQGIGKSKLIAEFLSRIEKESDAEVLFGQCYQQNSRPLSPFITPLQNKASEIDEEIRVSNADKIVLFKKLFYQYGNLSRKKKLLLVIEDIHWADSLTVEFINYFIRNIINYNILLIMTYRVESVGLNHTSMVEVEELRRVMAKDPTLLELHLHELSGDDIILMITKGGELKYDGEILNFIEECSAGNPLFAKEWLTYIIQNKLIGKEGLPSGSIDSVRQFVPSTIKEVILGRFGLMNETQRTIFEYGAIIGPSFDIRWLEPIMDITSIEILSHLEGVEIGYDLLTIQNNIVSFYHESIWRILYDSIPQVQKRRMHLELANWLVSSQTNVPSSIICDQYQRGGDDEKTRIYAFKAASNLLSEFAVKEAEHYFRLTIELSPLKDSIWLSSIEGCADTLFEQSDYENAIPLFEEKLSQVGSDDERGRILLKLADCWAPMRYAKGSWVKYKELLDKVASLKNLRPEEEGEYWSDMSGYHSSKDEKDLSMECRKHSIECFKKTARWDKTAWELTCFGVQTNYYGNPCLGLGHIIEALEIYQGHSRPKGEEFAHMAYGETLLGLGLLEESEEQISVAVELSKEIGEYYEAIFGHYFLAMINLFRYDYENALAHAMIGVEIAENQDSSMFACMPGWEMVLSYIMMDDIESAKDVHEKLLNVYSSYASSSSAQLRAFINIITNIMEIVTTEGYDIEKMTSDLNVMNGKQNENLNKGLFLFFIGIVLKKYDMKKDANETLIKARDEFLAICNYPLVMEIEKILNE